MTAPPSQIPPIAASGHVGGDVLLAVAEGDPRRQPSDEQLAHVFSCERCSADLRELRSGLAAFGAGASTVRAPGAAERRAAPASALDETLALGVLAAADDDADYQRSRRAVVKVVAVGVLLALGMLWLRSFAAQLH